MTEYITSVQAIGIHGQFDFFCQFQEGVNIIFGKNGTGKTTLLHILANVLNRDFSRFAVLNFKSIKVEFSNKESIQIKLEKEMRSSNHYHGKISVNGELLNKESFCSLRVLENDDEIKRVFPEESKQRRSYRTKNGEIVYYYRDNENPNQLKFDFVKNTYISSAYFPSFRTAIDAWAINFEEKHRVNLLQEKLHQRKKTEFARSLFGPFVPRLDYPATTEIEYELNEQIKAAIANVSQADRTYFGDVPSKILEDLSKPSDSENTDETKSLLREIEALSVRFQKYPIEFESMGSKLNKSVQLVPNDKKNRHVISIVLKAYKEALNSIVKVQEDSFGGIERYLKSVNKFLENKNLLISAKGVSRRPSPAIALCFDGQKPVQMSMSRAFSSGERQIVTLIYATTKMSQQDVVLIDEPEISLNVDWQRKLLPEMVSQMPSKQLIVCTHSPLIGAKYRSRMIDLKATATHDRELSYLEIDENLVGYDEEL